jgi:DNA phosphorothioation-dependent restriction protein DptG
MAMKHVIQIQVSIGIIRFLQSEFNGTLQFLYIVNGGVAMATAFKACYPFLSKGFIQRIHYLNGRPFELLDALIGMAWRKGDLVPLMGRLQKEYAV